MHTQEETRSIGRTRADHARVDRTWDSAFGEGSFDRTFGDGASERMDRVADSLFGGTEDRAAARDYAAYLTGGGTMGYDSWRFNTGNYTYSFTNDLRYGVSPTLVNAGGGGATMPDDPFHQSVEIGGMMASLAAVMASRYNTDYARNNSTVAILAASSPFGSGQPLGMQIVFALSGQPGTFSTRMTNGQRQIYDGVTGNAINQGVFGSIHNASQFRVTVPGVKPTHAEPKAIGFAQRRGFSPLAIGTSRPFRDTCGPYIQSTGGSIVGPRIAVWP